jgi:hypothetical protein
MDTLEKINSDLLNAELAMDERLCKKRRPRLRSPEPLFRRNLAAVHTLLGPWTLRRSHACGHVRKQRNGQSDYKYVHEQSDTQVNK